MIEGVPDDDHDDCGDVQVRGHCWAGGGGGGGGAINPHVFCIVRSLLM